MTTSDPLDDFERAPFTGEGRTLEVLRRGAGPAVIVVHEIPGITPEVARFARRVAAEGYTVLLPRLFGTPGRPDDALYVAQGVIGACVSRELSCLRRGRSSPVTDTLRALARHAHATCGGRGVGVVGMCLTGNFALAMVGEPSVVVPVLSQPSTPFPVSAAHRRDPGVEPEVLEVARRRAREEDLVVLGLRFTGDVLCPSERFDHLAEALGDGFERIDVPSGPGAPFGHGRWAHSVLTRELVDEVGQPTRAALDRVLELFHQRLHG